VTLVAFALVPVLWWWQVMDTLQQPWFPLLLHQRFITFFFGEVPLQGVSRWHAHLRGSAI
jgi:hypothetical protein